MTNVYRMQATTSIQIDKSIYVFADEKWMEE